MANYRVYFTYNAIEYEIFKKMGFGDSTFESKKVDGQIFYRKELNGVISFLRGDNKDAYDAIIELFTDSTKRCDKVSVRISKTCSGVTNENCWNGTFTASQMGVNFCTCRIDVEPIINDEYSCLIRNEEKELNWYNSQPSLLIISNDCISNEPSLFVETETFNNSDLLPNTVVMTNYQLGFLSFEGGGENVGNYNFYSKDTLGTDLGYGTGYYPKAWWLVFTNAVDNGDGTTTVSSFWSRELWSCGVPPAGNGWVFDSEDNVWARERINLNYNISNNVYGIELKNGIENLLEDLDCDTNCVVSDFFNINPDNTNPTNIAYDFANNNLADLYYTAKTQVKKLPTVPSDFAQYDAYFIKIKDLLENLKNIFNVRWKVIDGCLRIEHISYFVANNIDLGLTPICTLTYEEETPQYEEFKMMDTQSDYFDGKRIEYPFACSKTGESETYDANIFSTDILYIQNNIGDINNEGFCLIATDGSLNIIDSNRPLSYTILHENLWKWDRYQRSFTMNGEDAIAETVKYTRTSNPIITDCICDIDPSNLINTERGQAEIINMSEKISTGTIKLTLGYE